MYVDIVLSNVFNLNKHFFFVFFFLSYIVVIPCVVIALLCRLRVVNTNSTRLGV